MLIAGIDPGSSGGLAVLNIDGQLLGTYKFKNMTERDIWDALTEYPIAIAYLEKVHTMPGQGVASSGKFMGNYGLLRGLLIAGDIPFENPTPQRWQKSINCMTGGDKNVTKRKAQELFPGHKITHAIADAILIAEYGRRERLFLSTVK